MILLTVRRCCSHRDSLPPDKNISVTENSSSREPHFCHKLLINASCTDRLQCQEQTCPERPSQHPLGITHPHWGLHYLSSCRKGMTQLDVNVVSQIVNLLCPPFSAPTFFRKDKILFHSSVIWHVECRLFKDVAQFYLDLSRKTLKDFAMKISIFSTIPIYFFQTEIPLILFFLKIWLSLPLCGFHLMNYNY